MSGNCDLRSKWGLRFARSKDGGKSSDYSGSQVEKLQLREQWAKAEMTKIRDSRERKDTYSQLDLSRSRYKPLSMIYAAQGVEKDPGAMQAAKNICLDCIARGSPWYRVGLRSERVGFIDVEEGWGNTMEKSWSLVQKKYDDDDEKDGQKTTPPKKVTPQR